jgi:hypothetical protein
MKRIILYLLILMSSCTNPEIRPKYPVYVNTVESRFRVPQYDLCGSFWITDTVLSPSDTKHWYNLAARDSTLPCDQHVDAHGRSGTVRSTDIVSYAHFLIRTETTYVFYPQEGTSINLYNQFKGNCNGDRTRTNTK